VGDDMAADDQFQHSGGARDRLSPVSPGGAERSRSSRSHGGGLELVHRVHLLKGQWETQSEDDVRQPDYRPAARAAGDAVE